MRARFVNEKFKDDTDPIKDMGIGMSEAEAILQTAIELFGDMEIVHKNTPAEKKKNQYEWEMKRSLPMSMNDWKVLKDKVGLKIIPAKFVEKYEEWDHGVKTSYQDLNYCHLLKNIYGEDFYFDSMDLVQYDRTIVSLFGLDGLTFADLMKKVKSSPKLSLIKPRK